MKNDSNFDITLGRVRELQEDEDGEYPTAYAFERTMALLDAVYSLTKVRPFPRASAATDERGAISLYWHRHGCSVHLTIGSDADRPSYIYHRDGIASELDREVTAEKLARWIDWFAS